MLITPHTCIVINESQAAFQGSEAAGYDGINTRLH